jgi:hypothetical protein
MACVVQSPNTMRPEFNHFLWIRRKAWTAVIMAGYRACDQPFCSTLRRFVKPRFNRA